MSDLREEIISILDEGIRPVQPIADEIIAKVLKQVREAVEKLKFGRQPAPELLFKDDVLKAIDELK